METVIELVSSVTSLVDSMAGLVTDSPWTYLVVLALAAFDAVLPILPGESVVLVAAVLAGSGRLDIYAVILAAGVGAFLGDNLAYWVGRLAGRPLVLRLLRGRAERLDWVEAQFKERGGSLILVGRFVPGGRTVVGIGAGVVHHPWPRYLAFDAVAASLWAFQAAIPGYLGGVLFADRPWLGLLIGVALSLAIMLAIQLVRRIRGRGSMRSREPEARAPSGSLATGADLARVTVRSPAARPDGEHEKNESDAAPGAHRRPDEPELTDP